MLDRQFIIHEISSLSEEEKQLVLSLIECIERERALTDQISATWDDAEKILQEFHKKLIEEEPQDTHLSEVVNRLLDEERSLLCKLKFDELKDTAGC